MHCLANLLVHVNKNKHAWQRIWQARHWPVPSLLFVSRSFFANPPSILPPPHNSTLLAFMLVASSYLFVSSILVGLHRFILSHWFCTNRHCLFSFLNLPAADGASLTAAAKASPVTRATPVYGYRMPPRALCVFSSRTALDHPSFQAMLGVERLVSPPRVDSL